MTEEIVEGTKKLTMAASENLYTGKNEVYECHCCHLVYISEKGSDENGDGSEAKPFKSVLQAMRSAGKEPFPVMYVDAKDDSDQVCNS